MILNFKLFESMENNYIKLKGIIKFDPKDKTRKHKKQSSWKKVAMIFIEGDVCDYYASFIQKRYGIKLNTPLRGPHISFINDSLRDIKKGLNLDSEEEAEKEWQKLKEKYHNKEINVYLDPDAFTDGKYWWLKIPEEKRDKIHEIRKEIGLGRPFFGLHMTIGYANERNIEQSKYIANSIKKFKN